MKKQKNKLKIKNLAFDSKTKLIPAIVQDSETKVILMHAYMNQESLKLTLKTNKVTFYSRSRQALWTKGETSGNFLNLVSITTDCDQDTLLIQAQPEGPTCHLGTTSCFDSKDSYIKSSAKIKKSSLKENNSKFKKENKKTNNLNNRLSDDLTFLSDLEAVINDRFENKKSKKSYINSLIKSGLDKIIQKVGEEATETVIAAKNKDKKEFIYESSDLLFHLLVLLRAKNSSLSDLISELKRRNK
jgi:phosphoribosyl-AMP cyclohydrolase / phosphoribosyl-ATP pyrophosphohydrolase